MSTTLLKARRGETTPQMEQVAASEKFSPDLLRERIALGQIVIPNNHRRACKAVGIGKGLRTKVNASIGTSPDLIDLKMEIEKAQIAERFGADTLMELSTGGDLRLIRRTILNTVQLPVGSVPLYQSAVEAIEQSDSVLGLNADLIFKVIEEQLEDGISFMAVHCGINLLTLERLQKQGYRHGGVVSRGGASMLAWMLHHQKENPLYEQFDRVVDLFKRYDAVLSLGNGLRAGAIHDASDRAQIQELILNIELAESARQMGVQTMVEGPGHIPIDEIEANVVLQKKMSHEAPFYMLGPITTDIAPGYDHITAAIGAAMAAAYGTDFICYVTPAEHLALPYPDDVKTGVISARIAAHVGDMIKLKDRKQDWEMAQARHNLDWERQFSLAIDPETARRFHTERMPKDAKTCTMCGSHCALKVVNEHLGMAMAACA
ncbi:MAG: phosphomethylpyrimidine synthase ThiC [Candidatus Schekmanbacteria bacterium]|nr:phosphomethylpyrimidine synthase ThiC [Candidatus Schekmanbacteria bacterium]